MDHIDAIYYINLDHREDRNREFLECMRDLQVPTQKIHRVPAIYDNIGALGCTRSHIKTIETFLESGLNICLVCEDDFQYKNKDTFWSDIKKVFDTNVEFDILQLSYNHQYYPEYYYKTIDTDYEFLKKVIASITSSSYIITRKFAPRLLENFKESSNLLRQFGLINNKAFVLDIFWHKLQPNCNWYLIKPSLGYQRESYSDVCKSHQNYKI